DGTCSLNCYITNIGPAPCNYDGYCDEGEGCTCEDCDDEQDECEEGLLCSLIDEACCRETSDNYCNPYCSNDPDCDSAVYCGNSIVDSEEQCDLGTRNGLLRSGCLADCTYEDNILPPCPEGLTLCEDGTCSLNCYITNIGPAPCNYDTYCDSGVEGCTCEDCDDEQDECEEGLLCSLIDEACCRETSDDYCNPYCSNDPDCGGGGIIEGILGIGTCSYTENSQDTCTDDGRITRSLSALWTWDNENSFTEISSGENVYNYKEEPLGVFRYDPLRKSENCVYIEDTFACPASVEVSFFGVYQLVIVIVIVGLIYLLYALRKKHHSKHSRNSKIRVRKRKHK
ncbi:MAG: hypothetical protein NTZ83_03645, partial [Candidatus Pacearchaeota archaeon]|nr:hypothetical protein [Candidatus Pacearchaeota archaeon]